MSSGPIRLAAAGIVLAVPTCMARLRPDSLAVGPQECLDIVVGYWFFLPKLHTYAATAFTCSSERLGPPFGGIRAPLAA